MERVQLEIGSFVLEKRVRIVAFEVPSGAVQTWRHYYTNAHILIFVVDQTKLVYPNTPGIVYNQRIIEVLREIDQRAPNMCQLMVVFSKNDIVTGK